MGDDILPPHSWYLGEKDGNFRDPRCPQLIFRFKSMETCTFPYISFTFQHNPVRTTHTCNNLHGSQNHYIEWRVPESKATNGLIPSI